MSFFSVRKIFQKEKSNGEIFNKSYSLRFIGNAKFMSASLDFLANNISDRIYNRKCKYFMECNNCKLCEKCKDKSLEWCKIYEDLNT